MYELIILTILMQAPAHGYLITKIINDIIGPFAKMSNGRLYPLMAKMQEDGLIVLEETSNEQDGRRPIKTFRVTEAGRDHFHKIMLETTKNPGEYQKLFLQKVSAFSYITPAERLKLLDHYINYCESHILHLNYEAQDLQENKKDQIQPERLENVLTTMHHRVTQWQLELEWAKSLRAKNEPLLNLGD